MIEHLTPCGGRCWALGSCHLLGPHSAREGSGSGHIQAYGQGYPPRQAVSPLVVSCALRRHFSPCCQHRLSLRRKSTESQQQPAKQASRGSSPGLASSGRWIPHPGTAPAATQNPGLVGLSKGGKSEGTGPPETRRWLCRGIPGPKTPEPSAIHR